MIRFARDLRLIPIVLVAVGSLFTLKVLGLVVDGGYTLSGVQLTKPDPQPDLQDITGSVPATARSRPSLAEPGVTASRPAPRQQSWAQQMFNFPDVTGSVEAPPPPIDVTGSMAAAPKEKKPEPEKPAHGATKPEPKKDGEAKTDAKIDPNTTQLKTSAGVIPLQDGRLASPAERALLERLQERREELNSRSRELDIRESLLKAAEKRLEARVVELKKTQSQMSGEAAKESKAEAERFKSLVTMYENMKAKDAAKIFDRLEMKVLIQVASKINPRRMSDIMGQMTAEAAEKLTVELATRASMADRGPAPPDSLPKIKGQPSGS